jgi:probable F420-dependent oxidoreductase
MLLAYGAWSLQRFSQGRFALGLGTQVKGNIEGRYGVPWTPPVRRIREYLQVLKMTFEAFQNGGGVDFQGEDYRITRLQPRFNPGPHDYPKVPLLLGGVGPAMARLVGQHADGIITHASNTNPRYLREVTIPNIELGAQRARRDPKEIELNINVNLITGATKEEMARRRETTRETYAFYYSTPPYWPTLELYGWGDLGPELREMTRQGRWKEMTARVSDDMLDTLVPQGTYDEIADVIKDWFGDVATSIGVPLPEDPADDKRVAEVIRRLQAM